MPTIDVRDPTDTQLMAASRFDGVHFGAVLDRHADTVRRYLSDRLGAEGADADIAEVFATAYTARRHFRSWQDSARPWLLGVATGVVRKHWRLELEQLRRIGRGPAPFAAPVAELLQHLDARDRDVMILAAWGGLEPAAIAMALDLPVGTVAARLDGLAQQVATRAGAAGVANGVDLLRGLRPVGSALDPDQLGALRTELREATGQPTVPGTPRPTSSVAAEHEQLRRWRTSPGAVVASLRARSSTPS
jgi:RNA polymerase sigma-70 factor (ECF subfamily)